MTQVAFVLLWVLVGHGMAAAAWFGLINTPESNILMLAVSASLVVVGALVLLWTSASAARALVVSRPPWRGLSVVTAMLPGALLGVLVVGVLCGLAGWFEGWWTAHAGQVDAAAIAAGDVTDTAWLHEAVRWTVALVQWVLVPTWLATSLAWAAAYGTRHVASMKWLLVGLHPRVVVVALVAVVMLVWLPWQGVYWRPASLRTSLEPAFIVLKLGTLYVAANLAWVLVLAETVRLVRR